MTDLSQQATDAAAAVRAVSPGHALPGPDRAWRTVLAVAIVGGPVAFLVGGVLAPAVHGTAAATLAANEQANPVTNAVHVAAFVVASYLLPLGALGLAVLARPGAPRLATIGGLLAVVGWLPFSALAALDDLAAVMAGLPGSASSATVLDRFTNDGVMNSYLIVYIVCHLVAYVLLGVALRRARVSPSWAAWALIASSPLTIAAFVAPGRPIVLGEAALALLVLGSLSPARAMLRTALAGR